MRNPLRMAAICAAFVLPSAALIWFGIQRLETMPEDGLGTAAMIAGLMAGPIPLYFLIQALFHARGRAKLLMGVGVIARWRVDAATWRRFRGIDDRRGDEDTHRLLSEFWFRKRPPGDGIEIIVGEKSLLIDDSYHVLRPRGLPELRSIEWRAGPGGLEYLEFDLVYPRGRYGGVQHMALRVPIPSDARADARRVYDWFEPRTRRAPAIALRNPKKTRLVCLFLFLLAAAAAGTGYAIARATDFHFASSNEAILPLVLIIGGLGLAIIAAALSLATIGLAGRARR